MTSQPSPPALEAAKKPRALRTHRGDDMRRPGAHLTAVVTDIQFFPLQAVVAHFTQ